MAAPQLQLTPGQAQHLLSLLFQHVPHLQVWAFGSRVKGTARPSSDLDLVFFAEEADKPLLGSLREALEESLLPFAVDMLVWNDISAAFQAHIQSQFIELQKPVAAKVGA